MGVVSLVMVTVQGEVVLGRVREVFANMSAAGAACATYAVCVGPPLVGATSCAQCQPAPPPVRTPLGPEGVNGRRDAEARW
jgi:hypothetical protein